MEVKFQEKALSFRPDQGLMYLIQQVTGQQTDEILGFFYDFGKQVFIVGIDNMKGYSIRKDIQALYPGTSIPFKILVKGEKDRWYSYQNNKKSNDNDNYYRGSIEITFPDNPVYMDTEKLMDIIAEKQLLGGSSLPSFEPPKSRTPKLYKDLIEQVLKGSNDENLQHSGHSRETGSPNSTVE